VSKGEVEFDMPFQFQCPRGHLLEADESQVGQQCQCPMCNDLFVIPAPLGTPAFPAPSNFHFEQSTSPASHPFSPIGSSPRGGPILTNSSPPGILHIPCPQGHELEVPLDMLGQDVMCPHCQTQFRLRDKDSVEYKEKKRKELELKDYKSGQLWMMWAVVVAVVVLLGLAIMIGVSASQ
jgi:hypothetical protein